MARRSEYRGTDKSRAPRGRKVTVKEENTLLPFLFGLLNEQSKSSVKALLAHGQISVNGTVTSQFNTPLTPGDEVLISYERGKVEFNNPLLTIVWEDDDLIVVNKKEGLLSVSSTRVKERTALHLLSEYVKKTDPRNKIFVLHRLDRDTSGLMMFAKNLQVQKALQSNWNSAITARTYVAVVEGRPEKDSDLKETGKRRSPATACCTATEPIRCWNSTWRQDARTRYAHRCNQSDTPSPAITSMVRRQIPPDG